RSRRARRFSPRPRSTKHTWLRLMPTGARTCREGRHEVTTMKLSSQLARLKLQKAKATASTPSHGNKGKVALRNWLALILGLLFAVGVGRSGDLYLAQAAAGAGRLMGGGRRAHAGRHVHILPRWHPEDPQQPRT